jgi:hypothetical protein
MDIKATIDTDTFGYRNRLLLIALAALFYAALCVYDATVKYPDQIEARQALEDLKAEYPADWKDRWPEVAEANDWDGTKEPKDRSEGDIATQWWQFAIVFPIGSYCLFNVLLWSRRYIGIDDTTFYAYGNTKVPFDKITKIDASRWERKGIARLYYDLGNGEKNVLIDDFKYDREPTDAIFKRLTETLSEDKIEGLTESPVDSPSDAEAETLAAESTDPQPDASNESEEDTEKQTV